MTDENRAQRVAMCRENLRRLALEGKDKFLRRVVTGDESWVHHYTPKTRQASSTWKHRSSPRSSQVRHRISAGKVMLSLFFDYRGPLLIEFTERGTPVNAARYVDTLMTIHKRIKRKRPGLLSKKVLFHHDNAPAHSANITQGMLESMKWDALAQPPYSPDLAPSDFRIFGLLKIAISGLTFESDEDVQKWVTRWINNLGPDVWRQAIYDLPVRWQKCIEEDGEYIEK